MFLLPGFDDIKYNIHIVFNKWKYIQFFLAVSSFIAGLETYDIFGNPSHPLISHDYSMSIESSPKDHTLWIRCKCLLFNIWYRLFYYWQLLPKADIIARKYFGSDIPYLGDICQKYSSILLTNVNLVTNSLRANVPNVVEFDQIHIRENRSLPKVIYEMPFFKQVWSFNMHKECKFCHISQVSLLMLVTEVVFTPWRYFLIKRKRIVVKSFIAFLVFVVREIFGVLNFLVTLFNKWDLCFLNKILLNSSVE